MTQTTSYHIYYEDKVLFKNLDLEEFSMIWSKIYRSYHTDSLTYAICRDEDLSTLEQSY